MMQKAKKRTLFLIGLLITGILGTLSTYTKSNYSQEESLFATRVYADLQAYEWDYGSCGGDGGGCGGCSSGDSGY